MQSIHAPNRRFPGLVPTLTLSGRVPAAGRVATLHQRQNRGGGTFGTIRTIKGRLRYPNLTCDELLNEKVGFMCVAKILTRYSGYGYGADDAQR